MKMTGKMSIYLAVAASLVLASPLAAAVDVGLGVSLYNNGGEEGGYGVSLPLRFGSMMVEPELSFYNSSTDYTYPSSPTNNNTYDYESYTLETGVYWRRLVVPSVETYVGGRVGYTKYDQTVTYPLNPGSSYSSKQSGVYIGPTLGAEYFFNKHFSLGLDVSLLYQSMSGDRTGGSPYSQDSDQIYYQSRTRLRVYF